MCRRTADALGFANECRHMSRRLSDIFGHSTATTRRHSGTHTRSALRIWLVRCSAAQARGASFRLQPKLHSVVISLSSRSLAHRAGHLPLRTARLEVPGYNFVRHASCFLSGPNKRFDSTHFEGINHEFRKTIAGWQSEICNARMAGRIATSHPFNFALLAGL